jgi:hypothetical protein
MHTRICIISLLGMTCLGGMFTPAWITPWQTKPVLVLARSMERKSTNTHDTQGQEDGLTQTSKIWCTCRRYCTKLGHVKFYSLISCDWITKLRQINTFLCGTRTWYHHNHNIWDFLHPSFLGCRALQWLKCIQLRLDHSRVTHRHSCQYAFIQTLHWCWS